MITRSKLLLNRPRFYQPFQLSFSTIAPPTTPVKENEPKKKFVLDKRVWPVALSSLVGGCAIGVVFPVMPLFAKQLGLNSQDFGLVVSVVGITRLLMNIPAAWLTDRFGRRSTLIGGPILSAIGMAFTATSKSLTELGSFRFITGLGGSLQMTGAQMYLSDISTPETRARTMASTGIGFATGATLGPALGGYLSEAYGLQAPFTFVASAVSLVALLNYRLIPETRKIVPEKPKTMSEEFRDVSGQWLPIVRNPDLRKALILNFTYWSVASGCVWTLLPLLANEQFSFSASQLGHIFSLMSGIGIIGLAPSAYISDKFGRKATLLPATILVSAALACIPHATSKEQLYMLISIYATGATLFQSTPSAFVADKTNEENRGQALALLRSAGDAGLFIGASSFGTLFHVTSPTLAFGTASVALLIAGGNFVIKK